MDTPETKLENEAVAVKTYPVLLDGNNVRIEIPASNKESAVA